MTTKPTYSELRQMLVDMMAIIDQRNNSFVLGYDVYQRAKAMLKCFPEPTQPSNSFYESKWNVADMKGNLIRDEVVEGKYNIQEWLDWANDKPKGHDWPVLPGIPVCHSPTPAEVLDHWLFCREEYFNNLNNTKVDHEDQEASDDHLQMLDEQLKELDEAAEDVNKLFNRNYSDE